MTPSAYVFGLFEFLNQKPMFSSELFDIYRLCRVTAVTVKAEVINLSSTVPLIIAVGTIPWSASSSTFDPYLLAERSRAVSRTVATSTGMSRSIINKTFYSFDELGNPVYDKSHWFDSVQASNSTPQDQEAPCVMVSVGAADATSTWAGLATYTVTYHVQYFELQWADFSLNLHRTKLKQNVTAHPRQEDIESDSEFERRSSRWEEPTPRQKAKMKSVLGAKGPSGKASEAR